VTNDLCALRNLTTFFRTFQVFMMTNVAKKGDIYRVIYGYDNDGNVCGRVNSKDSNFPRMGRDFTHLP